MIIRYIYRKVNLGKQVFGFLFLVVSFSTSTAWGYGYARNEDPLLTVFKAVIFYGKESDWNRVKKEVDSISDRFEDVRVIFDIDLKPMVDEAVEKQDLQELAKLMANFVFLAIKEKHYYNSQENLNILIRSKVRLRIAEEYYTSLLAGNVMGYDRRHGTHLHDSIMDAFVRARPTLGSLGFLGAGGAEPNPEEFDKLATEIEMALLQAFPYFMRGKEVSDVLSSRK